MDIKRLQSQFAKLRACVNCLYLIDKNDADKCPNCDGQEFEDFKGFVGVIDPQKSYV